jgi:hypothetical protein
MVTVLLCVVKRLDFGVWQARAPMPAAPDDFPALHQYCAHHRIRRSHAVAALREAQRKPHELGVRQTHFTVIL